MEILKDQEAIDYLKRARSCLHPNEDDFSGIPLLASLLDIEITYLDHVNKMGAEELSSITISWTGFPQMDSWKQDIQNIFGVYDAANAKRAGLLNSFLQQIIDVSSGGISNEGKKLAKTLEQDKELMLLFDNLTDQRKETLKNPPFEEDKNFGYLSKNPDYYDSMHASFKYIDSKYYRRSPFIAYDLGHEDPHRVRLMTPNCSLTSCSRKYETDEIVDYRSFGPLNIPVFKKKVDILKSEKPPSGPYFADYQTIKIVEKCLSDVHPAVLKSFLCADFARFSDRDTEVFLSVLPRLDAVIKDTLKISDRVLRSKSLSGSSVLSETLALSVSKIFSEISDDGTKKMLQVALAEALEPVMKKSAILSQLALPQPGRRAALPPPRSLARKLFGGFKGEDKFKVNTSYEGIDRGSEEDKSINGKHENCHCAACEM